MWLDVSHLTLVYDVDRLWPARFSLVERLGVPPYTILLRLSVCHRFLVAIARGPHLFPFRTEPLSPAAPMVLPLGGRVGRCQVPVEPRRFRASGLSLFVLVTREACLDYQPADSMCARASLSIPACSTGTGYDPSRVTTRPADCLARCA